MVATGIGIGTAISLGVAAGTATSGIVGAKLSANAAQHGADVSTDAANHAADLQAKSAADTLAFTKEQAAQARADADVTQHANYDQWAAEQESTLANARARTGTINALGSQYGVAPRADPVLNIPAYRSTLGGAATGVSPAPATGAPAASGAPTGNLSDPAVWMKLVGDPAALSTWTAQALGPKATPELVNYYVGKIQGQPGANPTEQAGGAQFWLGKMAAGATAEPRTATPAAVGPTTIGAAATALAPTPYSGLPAPPTTAALAVNPYQRRTIGDFFGTAA